MSNCLDDLSVQQNDYLDNMLNNEKHAVHTCYITVESQSAG